MASKHKTRIQRKDGITQRYWKRAVRTGGEIEDRASFDVRAFRKLVEKNISLNPDDYARYGANSAADVKGTIMDTFKDMDDVGDFYLSLDKEGQKQAHLIVLQRADEAADRFKRLYH
jgi:hypothetical protein